MNTYWVKTHDDRNLVIKADYFILDNNTTYKFYVTENNPKNKEVASIPAIGVFAVVEQDSWTGDFYSKDFIDSEEDE